MILIFLGNWRMTVIASVSIPLALLGAIIGLYVTGNTINAMTLGGLALAIGPLVDDAIVELENNHRNYSLGKSRIRAALDGCAEVMVPVLVATCTTNIVLAPIALMPGMGGFLFRPLALAVTFAMITSFLLSRTFVPMMCAKFLPDDHLRSKKKVEPVHDGLTPGSHPGEDAPGMHVPAAPGGHGEFSDTFFGRLHYRIEMFLERLTRGYEQLLATALRHRAVVLTVVGIAFIASLLLGTQIGREFFPQVDAGQITLYIRTPSNLRLDANETRVAQVEEFIRGNIPGRRAGDGRLRDRPRPGLVLGIHGEFRAAGRGHPRAARRRSARAAAQEYADPAAATLRGRSALRRPARQLRHGRHGFHRPQLRRLVADRHPDRRRRAANSRWTLAREVRNRVRGIAGAADARILQRLDAPYLVIDVDRQKAASVGPVAQDVI